MASLLRQIVAGPRAKHQETGLDLCYVTDFLIATSGPSQTYPQRAYRNPLDQLVGYLDAKHGSNWAIWEFRAEGTGYPDEAVHGRIRHYPWPDHHPPPFRLVPMIMASMRNWLQGDDLFVKASETALNSKGRLQDTSEARAPTGSPSAKKSTAHDRVVVVHCKAGKGRSGSMACSYLISECGWTPEDALARFTERRMRPQFGAGVSIPSQLRYVSYVDRWTKGGKKYVDREIEILEVHVWGLRHGVKVAIEGYADEGKRIQIYHTFDTDERQIVHGDAPGGAGMIDFLGDAWNPAEKEKAEGDSDGATYADITASPSSSTMLKRTIDLKDYESSAAVKDPSETTKPARQLTPKSGFLARNPTFAADAKEPGGRAVILKPRTRIVIPHSDINLTLDRRNRTPSSLGLEMVTAVAHVWFNPFFEGGGAESERGVSDDSGVFHINWEQMDGIKGSSRKGTKAADRISALWRAASASDKSSSSPQAEAGRKDGGESINEPKEGDQVPQMEAADWKGSKDGDPDAEKKLGVAKDEDADEDGARKTQTRTEGQLEGKKDQSAERSETDPLEGVKASGPAGEADI